MAGASALSLASAVSLLSEVVVKGAGALGRAGWIVAQKKPACCGLVKVCGYVCLMATATVGGKSEGPET